METTYGIPDRDGRLPIRVLEDGSGAGHAHSLASQAPRDVVHVRCPFKAAEDLGRSLPQDIELDTPVFVNKTVPGSTVAVAGSLLPIVAPLLLHQFEFVAAFLIGPLAFDEQLFFVASALGEPLLLVPGTICLSLLVVPIV
jgi:hypothetical protein